MSTIDLLMCLLVSPLVSTDLNGSIFEDYEGKISDLYTTITCGSTVLTCTTVHGT